MSRGHILVFLSIFSVALSGCTSTPDELPRTGATLSEAEKALAGNVYPFTLYLRLEQREGVWELLPDAYTELGAPHRHGISLNLASLKPIVYTGKVEGLCHVGCRIREREIERIPDFFISAINTTLPSRAAPRLSEFEQLWIAGLYGPFFVREMPALETLRLRILRVATTWGLAENRRNYQYRFDATRHRKALAEAIKRAGLTPEKRLAMLEAHQRDRIANELGDN